MGAGTMTRNMRLGLAILAAVLICAGCVGEPAGDFSSTAGQLDSALQELDGQDLLNGPVFAGGYSCCRLGIQSCTGPITGTAPIRSGR